MNPRVDSVEVLTEHKLKLVFTDGSTGIYDCAGLLDFGIFSELKDKVYFAQVRVIDCTVAWPNNQDICPDTLYMDSNKVA
jgi:hypothetical protein